MPEQSYNTGAQCWDAIILNTGAQCWDAIILNTGAQCWDAIILNTGAQCWDAIILNTGAQCWDAIMNTGAQCWDAIILNTGAHNAEMLLSWTLEHNMLLSWTLEHNVEMLLSWTLEHMLRCYYPEHWSTCWDAIILNTGAQCWVAVYWNEIFLELEVNLLGHVQSKWFLAGFRIYYHNEFCSDLSNWTLLWNTPPINHTLAYLLLPIVMLLATFWGIVNVTNEGTAKKCVESDIKRTECEAECNDFRKQ